MIKKILALLLLSNIALAAGPLQSKRTFQNVGGLVDHISPLLLDDTHASAIQNITMDDRGLLSKRNGYSVIQSTNAFIGYSTWTVTGGGYHTASSGNNFFTVVVGTAIYRISNTFSSYSSITGSVSITPTPSNLAQTADLQDRVVFCNEVDKPFYVQSTGNAATISTSTFSAAKTCATYGNYLVVGNTTESAIAFPSRIRWSDLDNVNSFPDLNFIDVEPDDGDKIVGVVSYDESVYIFKHRSIYRMLITGLDGPDAFIIRPFSRNIGAWAKNSIKVIPNVGIAFVAQNTAYLLNDQGLTPIGDSIQRTFDTVQRSQWVNIVGGVYPKKYQYWLAVSTTGSTNSEVLVYDYVQNNWTVFTDIKASMLAQSEDSAGNNLLISGDYNATTYKQDTGSTDNPRGVSTPISALYVSSNILLDTPDIRKGFKYIYIYTLGDQNYTLNTQAAYDFSSTFEFNQDVVAGSAGAVYDTGVYDTDVYPASGYQITRLNLDREARSIQLKFTNTTSGEIFGLIGWSLVYNLEDYTQ